MRLLTHSARVFEFVNAVSGLRELLLQNDLDILVLHANTVMHGSLRSIHQADEIQMSAVCGLIIQNLQSCACHQRQQP